MEKRYIYIRIHIYYKNVNTHAQIWYTCAHVTLNREGEKRKRERVLNATS